MLDTPSHYLLEVTDLKQYSCCPRIVFYRYCLPHIRPTTALMEEGIRQHELAEDREERRSLRAYGLKEGERCFHLPIQSTTLRLKGCIDLAIITPARDDPQAEALVVDYKYSEQKTGMHFKVQLAAYALLLEEAWGLSVRRGYIYALPFKRAESILITAQLRNKVVQISTAIRSMIEREVLPEPTTARARCVCCEFRRFCNDVV